MMTFNAHDWCHGILMVGSQQDWSSTSTTNLYNQSSTIKLRAIEALQSLEACGVIS